MVILHLEKKNNERERDETWEWKKRWEGERWKEAENLFFQNLKQQKVNTNSYRLFEAKVSQFVHDRSWPWERRHYSLEYWFDNLVRHLALPHSLIAILPIKPSLAILLPCPLTILTSRKSDRSPPPPKIRSLSHQNPSFETTSQVPRNYCSLDIKLYPRDLSERKTPGFIRDESRRLEERERGKCLEERVKWAKRKREKK